MKNKIFITALAAACALGCKKDEPKPEQTKERDPEVLVTSISTELKGADSISAFTNSLQTVALSKEETAEGITLFAPLNSAGTTTLSLKSASVSEAGSVATLPDSVVKNHIVKGVFRLSDLTDGKVMTGLNGKQLRVKRAGDTVWVNGVLLNARELAANSNQVVYVVRGTLQGTSVVDTAWSNRDFAMAMQETETGVANWYRNEVVFDALLSQDVSIDSIAPALQSANQRIGNFQFNGTESAITNFWQSGYQQIIRLNLLEEKIKNMAADRVVNTAKVKALRAFIYLQLLTYFENIPLTQSTTGMPSNLTNNNKAAVINYIRTELAASLAGLPATGANIGLNRQSVKAILAKLALLQKDYQTVATLTNEILATNAYSLAAPATIYTSSSEIIWNSGTTLSNLHSAFFFGRPSLPYFRITEIYLMNAEAKFSLGQNNEAQNLLAAVGSRSGAQVGQISMTAIRNLWRAELRREGSMFPNLIRWNVAADLLAPKGFVAGKHVRLPIPVSVLQLNPNLTQNSGY